MIARLVVLTLVLSAPGISSAIEVFEFENALQQERFRNLAERLRCPKCQNQSIADSNAPISEDLRKLVFELMKSGKTDAEIVDHLIERYGTFVTYRPPVTAVTWPLWFGPFAALLAVLIGVLVWVRRRASDVPHELSESERSALHRILEDTDGRELP